MHNLIELLQDHDKITISFEMESTWYFFNVHSKRGSYELKTKLEANLPQLLSELRNKL